MSKTFFEKIFKKYSEQKPDIKDIEALLEAFAMMQNKEAENMDKNFYDLYRDLKAENRIIDNKIDTTKWLLAVLISVFGLFTPLLFSLHARSIDAKIEAVNSTIKAEHSETQSELKLLRNDFQNLKELNKVEIQKEVLKHIK